MHPALAHVDHRPWPLPGSRWSWRQTWRELLFAHWPVPASRAAALRAAGAEHPGIRRHLLDRVVPFRMTGVMLRGVPDLPWVSAFPELNVRLYVERDGKPGVWFLSLDAANPLAVWAARRFFHLPYYLARMSMRLADGTFHYESRRQGAAFAGWYRPVLGGLRRRSGIAGALAHGALLPLCPPAGRLDLAQRGPPRAVAASEGGGRDRGEHDVRFPRPARRGPSRVAALRGAIGRGRVARGAMRAPARMRRIGTPFTLTKWYFDCVDAEARAVIGYWASLAWRGVALTWQNVTLFEPGKAPVSRSSLASALPPGEESTVRSPGARRRSAAAWTSSRG